MGRDGYIKNNSLGAVGNRKNGGRTCLGVGSVGHRLAVRHWLLIRDFKQRERGRRRGRRNL